MTYEVVRSLQDRGQFIVQLLQNGGADGTKRLLKRIPSRLLSVFLPSSCRTAVASPPFVDGKLSV